MAAKTVTQVLQLTMEAVACEPESDRRNDLLRALRKSQAMASSFGLDVPVTPEMSEVGRETLKNSPEAEVSSKSPARAKTNRRKR